MLHITCSAASLKYFVQNIPVQRKKYTVSHSFYQKITTAKYVHTESTASGTKVFDEAFSVKAKDSRNVTFSKQKPIPAEIRSNTAA